MAPMHKEENGVFIGVSSVFSGRAVAFRFGASVEFLQVKQWRFLLDLVHQLCFCR
jgi:hypothetical protein